MNRFACVEGGALKIKPADLYILPLYKTNKTDPIIRELLSYDLEPSVRANVLAEHKTGEIVIVPLTVKTSAWLVCLSESVSHFALRSVLGNVLNAIEGTEYKSIVMAQLGIIEYGCDNEEKWKRAQKSAMDEYVSNHPGLTMTMVVPGEDYRPQKGEHLGQGLIPEDDETRDPADIAESSTHHQIALNTRTIHSYTEYLEEYIKARLKQYEIISTHSGGFIEELRDLQLELKEYENRDRVESFEKWKHKTKKKLGDVEYCPVPSKKKLKLIILLLDMSYDEAVACLNFFGYGLARFDREDQAFTYIIKTNEGKWKKPLSLEEVDKALIRRFGKSAALIVKQGKKG